MAPQIPVLEAHGRELEALLAPITPQEFAHEYFGKKPLFVKGFKDKYKGLFDGDAFVRALQLPGPTPDDFLRASFDKRSDKPAQGDEYVSAAFRATVEQALPLFRAGATLCVTQMETRVPQLAPFVSAIKRQLGYTGKVSFNAYLSPAHTGFNWHFDGRIASTLQIEGTKRWRFSHTPAVEWPPGNGTLTADGRSSYAGMKGPLAEWTKLAPFDEKNTTEVVLEPGDLLILPAGVWHDACGGDQGSLALNLSFTAVSYTVFVRDLLDKMMAPSPSWRGPSPLLPKEGGAPGEVDPAGLALIAAELKRASEALGALAADSSLLARQWSSYVQNANPGQPPPEVTPPPPQPMQPTQKLRVRADGNVHLFVADGGARLCLTIGASRGMDVAGDAMVLVQRMVREGTFLASDVPKWMGANAYPWDDVAGLLAHFRAEGLLENA